MLSLVAMSGLAQAPQTGGLQLGSTQQTGLQLGGTTQAGGGLQLGAMPQAGGLQLGGTSQVGGLQLGGLGGGMSTATTTAVAGGLQAQPLKGVLKVGQPATTSSAGGLQLGQG